MALKTQDNKIHSNNSYLKWSLNKNIISIHRIISPVLTVGQFFGVMPVCGITDPTPDKLKFRWCCLRVFYTIIVIIGMALLSLASALQFAQRNMTFYGTIDVMFFTTGTLSLILFLRLSRKWPELMREWHRLEMAMICYKSPINLKRNILSISALLSLLGLFEHLLSVGGAVWASSDLQESVLYKGAALFKYIPYNIPLGFVHLWLNAVCTFLWTYSDTFVIVLSIGLAERFQCISYRIRLAGSNMTKDTFWKEIREDYNNIIRLCRSVNNHISCLLFLVIFDDLYFIGVQLFNLFLIHKDILASRSVYLSYSFCFLVGRTLSLIVIASKINEQSRALLPILFSLPTECFKVEVIRLINQIKIDMAVLTGLNFFRIRRGIILTVASTIVTYELVLIQYRDVITVNKAGNESLPEDP